jgi:hypothetical protein
MESVDFGQTPDFEAIERLLDARFGQASDDLDHEDFFGWGQSDPPARQKLAGASLKRSI